MKNDIACLLQLKLNNILLTSMFNLKSSHIINAHGEFWRVEMRGFEEAGVVGTYSAHPGSVTKHIF